MAPAMDDDKPRPGSTTDADQSFSDIEIEPSFLLLLKKFI